MNKSRYLYLLLFIYLLLNSSIAFCLDFSVQRKAFLVALANLQQNKQQEFNLISNHLKLYPLYPYLIYAKLAMHLTQSQDEEVQAFLMQYHDTPLAEHLRELWLNNLAKQQRWNIFLANYVPTKDLNLQCLQRQALWQTGQYGAAVNNIGTLWAKDQTPPKACLIVFTQAIYSGNLAKNLLWQRIEYAIQNNNLILANTLANLLPNQEKAIYSYWQEVYKNPQLLLQSELLKITKEQTERVLLTALKKVARHDPQNAVKLWQQIQAKNALSLDLQLQVTKALALALAESYAPEALTWLSFIPEKFTDEQVHEWRIRVAIRQQNWQMLKQAIGQLPVDKQKTAAWRYWFARACEEQGQIESARNIYRNLAIHGDFYGQLACLKLGQAPLSGIKTLTVNHEQIQALSSLPAMQRAYELYSLRWLSEARQEWQWAIQHIPEADYLAAAALAIQWGWYERAIATVNLMNDGGYIPIRFPLAYREPILSTAETKKINPAWLFALIRQESLFSSDARSKVGALGLMQLMPNTASLIAQQQHMRFSTASLFDASTNLNIGSIYLTKLLNRFKGQIILATAAYNAGPGRIDKWLAFNQHFPADVWIETIPWQETRQYVKNIMSGTTFYEHELGLPLSLANRMQPVQKL